MAGRHTAPLGPTTTEEVRAFLGELLSVENRARFESAGDLDVGYSLPDGRRFRFNLSRQRGRTALVARALPSGELYFEELGLPAALVPFAEAQRGLFLVTGGDRLGQVESAALTGHLVLATLHTVDATQTLQRILSYFPENLRAQAALDLSMSLIGVASQRLLPKADGTGRVAAVELLQTTPGVARLIREQRVDELVDLMRDAQGGTSISFNRALLDLYRREVITYDVGRAYATNPDEFALTAQGMESGVAAFRGEGAVEGLGVDMKALLRLALERGASDLHLTVGRPPKPPVSPAAPV